MVLFDFNLNLEVESKFQGIPKLKKHMHTIYSKYLDSVLSIKFNAPIKQTLRKLETQFFAYVQMR